MLFYFYQMMFQSELLNNECCKYVDPAVISFTNPRNIKNVVNVWNDDNVQTNY
jgi:hypothetical protein